MIFEILRLVADGCEGKDLRARADRGRAGDDDVADQLDALAQDRLWPDGAERADLDTGGELRARPRRWRSGE